MTMQNFGLSFGITFPWQNALVLIVWLGLCYYSIKEKSWWLVLAVIGGCLNMIERWINGYVSDYWRIPFTSIYNNINDWLIFVGIGVFIWKKLR